MAGLIPQSFIDELLTRTDIVEVIDSRVQLKKAGREYTACCPFHNEKTPSFTVSQVKQFYHCFGCGAHGSAIGFLMEYEHLNFPEAVEELARASGMEVPRETGPAPDPKVKQRQTSLFDLVAKCDRYYRQQLRQHPQAKLAVNYLKQRGLSGEIAAIFGMGYAPPGWDNLHKALNVGIDKEKEQQLIDCGMLIQKDEGGSYDRFRDRIMFPIRDQRGRTIAFGGRILPSDEAQGSTRVAAGGKPASTKAKYLNSPETPLFHKGRELYGLFEMRQALRKIPRILVVEGYMDVVALAQFHIRYAVATLGTATTPDHLNKLFRICPEVVFCFDGDRAGRDAAWRALDNALSILKEGHELRFLFLPDGEDPDSLVRKEGKEGFEARLDKATPLSEYFFDQLGKDLDLTSIDGRARLVKLAQPYLSRLADNLFRHMMIEQLARLAQIQTEKIEKTLSANNEVREPQPAKPQFIPKKANNHDPSLIRKGIKLLVEQPDLVSLIDVDENFQQLDLPGIKIFNEIIAIAKELPEMSTSALLSRLENKNYGPRLKALLSQERLIEGESLVPEFQGIINSIKKMPQQHRRDELYNKPFRELSAEDKKELQELDKLLF